MLWSAAVLVIALVPSTDLALGGRVVDARTGRPVAGALVTAAGSSEVATTGPDGRFLWPEWPAPPLTVIVLLPDGRVARPLAVAALNATEEMELAVDVMRTETITVPGIAPGVMGSPAASAVALSGADIGLRAPATVSQALELLAGVSIVGEGQGAAPAVRGLARGRTLLLLDGMRVTGERGAGPNAAFLDPALLARIDVARGPGSVAYGTDAFGGVIALHTRRPVAATGVGLRLSMAGGIGVPSTRGNLEATYGYRSGAILLGFQARSFQDYRSPNGVVPHSRWRDAGGRVRWEHAGVGGHWSIGWQGDEALNVHRPRSDSGTIVATSPFERSRRLSVTFARPVLRGWRDVHIETFAGGSAQRVEQERLPAPGRPRRVDRADIDARDMQLRATARRTLGRVRVHTGLDLQGRYGVAMRETAFVYTASGALSQTLVTTSIAAGRRLSGGVFGDAEVPLTRWLRVSAGIRGEQSRSRNEGGFFGDRTVAHRDVAATGALVLVPATALTVVAQAARGFREPTLSDRFFRGPVGRGQLEGNPDLGPETSRQFDLTARYRHGPVAISGAWYRYDITNLIERYLAATDQFRMRNRSRARLQGAEFEMRIDAGAGVTLDLLAQASRGRDATDGTPLDDIASASVGLVVRHAWRTHLSSYLRVTASAAHRRAGPGEVPTPGYTLVDAALSWRVRRGLDVVVTARNLLDARYYASAGPRWVWAPGRQASLNLTASR